MITEDDIPAENYKQYCAFVGGPADGRRLLIDVRNPLSSVAITNPPGGDIMDETMAAEVYHYERKEYRQGDRQFFEYHFTGEHEKFAEFNK